MSEHEPQDPLFGDARPRPERSDDDERAEPPTPPAAGPGQLTLDPTFEYRSARAAGRRPARPELRELVQRLLPEQRVAGVAAIGVVASMALPWWAQPGKPGASSPALLHVSFVELALALVSAIVLLLLYRRAEGRVFHLPLSDATLAAGAGAWCGFLLLYRMFDTPTVTVGPHSVGYDPNWGIVVAFGFAALMFGTGVRGRQRRHPGEPESLAADEDATPAHPLRGWTV